MNLKIQILAIFLMVLSINYQCIDSVPVVECPEHSTMNLCVSRCPITCSNYRNPPECLPVCQVGCECEPGFMKVSKNPSSPCVKEYECPLYTNKRGQGSRPYPFYKRFNGSTRRPTIATNPTIATSTTASA